MFERFSPGARNVLIASRQEARRLAQPYIGSEHILLGVICNEHELTVPVFANMAISLDRVRWRVEVTMGRGAGETLTQIQLTPRAITILELSLVSAMETGDGMIKVDNILLGLIAEGSGVSTQILARLGVDLEQLRQTLIWAMSGGMSSTDDVKSPALSSPTADRPLLDAGSSPGKLAGRDLQIWSMS